MNIKKNIIIIFSSLLILSVLILSSCNFLSENKSDTSNHNQIEYVYTINGRNENWQAKNLNLTINNNSFRIGNGTIEYVDNNEDWKLITLIIIEIVKVDKKNKKTSDVLYIKTITSNEGGILQKPIINIGSLEGPINNSNNFFNKSKHDLFLVITYKNKDLQMSTDRIKLNVTNKK